MKKTVIIIVIAVFASSAVILGVFWKDALGRLKREGYIAYTPEEAETLAYSRCSQCHNTEKIAKYCMRCGPPLAIVVHNMKTLTRLERERGRTGLQDYSDAEAVAIAEVWNALVGNWEEAWRKEDLVKLLEGDKALIRLIETPVKQRPIETALAGKSAPGVYKEMQGGK